MADASVLIAHPDEFHAPTVAQKAALPTTSTDAAATPHRTAVTATGNGGDDNPATSVGTVPVSYVELAIGFAALVLWFVLFGGGILIGTEPYRNQIAGGAAPAQEQATPSPAVTWSLRLLMGVAAQPSTSPQHRPPTLLTSVFMVLAFWTITNVALLCCLAAYIGALGRRTRFAVLLGDPSDHFDCAPQRVRLHYASAVIRGFSIYCLMMAGLLVLATEQFKAPDPGTYLRLAATVTVISFYAGYDPSVLAGLLSRIKRLINGESAADKPRRAGGGLGYDS